MPIRVKSKEVQKCKSELENFHMVSTLVNGINVDIGKFKVIKKGDEWKKQLQILFNVDISNNLKNSPLGDVFCIKKTSEQNYSEAIRWSSIF